MERSTKPILFNNNDNAFALLDLLLFDTQTVFEAFYLVYLQASN